MSGGIVSLQLGHYSNHIGTHLWNGIENTFVYDQPLKVPSEINNDVLYRAGYTEKGYETYTPRLLLTDLRNALGAVSETGDLYHDDEHEEFTEDSAPFWDKDIEVIRQPPIEQNEYIKDVEAAGISTSETITYNLDNLVNTWTDYLYARFHPRTVSIIKSFERGHLKRKFDTFSNGRLLWQTRQFEEDFCDNIRKYVEECDRLQGFHVTLDSTDGFSGLGSLCLEHIKDEFTPDILTFPVISSGLPTEPMDVSIRVANLALCYRSLIESSALFIPLSLAHATHWRLTNYQKLPYINYKNDSFYQTSAIVANYIDTITLPYRLKNSNYCLKGFCSDLSGFGRKMAAGSIGLPFGINDKMYLIDYLNTTEQPMFISLTPNCPIASDKTMQIFALRGVKEDMLKKHLREAGKQIQMEAYKCNSIKDMMEFYFTCNGYASGSNVTNIESAYKLPSSYPQFFTDNINKSGFVDVVPREENQSVREIPLIAGAHNTLTVFDSLTGLIRETERIKISKIHRFKETGLEEDEYSETLEALKAFQENYEENVYL